MNNTIKSMLNKIRSTFGSKIYGVTFQNPLSKFDFAFLVFNVNKFYKEDYTVLINILFQFGFSIHNYCFSLKQKSNKHYIEFEIFLDHL